MEDYYRLLDIDERADLDAIRAHLAQLNRETRRSSNHRDHTVREEAQTRLQHINRALTHFASAEERARYDRELAGQRAEEELQQPLADIDLYLALDLAETASAAAIEAALQQAEANLGPVSEDDPAAMRRRKLLALARRTLLDADKRRDYDATLRARREHAQRRASAGPTPLRVGETAVRSWSTLEPALAQHLDEAVELFLDGELEAWLRWSLGQRQRAAWVRALTRRAKGSQTPLMELEELLRASNPARPFRLYPVGGDPAQAHPLHTPAELPPLADAHWAMVAGQLAYLLDWLSLQEDTTLYPRIAALPAETNPNIRLERLLVCIDPQLPAPQLKVQGLESDNVLDFGVLQAWTNPAREFSVRHVGRGYLFGSVIPRAPWVRVEPTHFHGPTTTIQVRLATNQLVSGREHEGTVDLVPLDGRAPTVSLRVRVQQRSLMQSVKQLFKRS